MNQNSDIFFKKYAKYCPDDIPTGNTLQTIKNIQAEKEKNQKNNIPVSCLDDGNEYKFDNEIYKLDIPTVSPVEFIFKYNVVCFKTSLPLKVIFSICKMSMEKMAINMRNNSNPFPAIVKIIVENESFGIAFRYLNGGLDETYFVEIAYCIETGFHYVVFKNPICTYYTGFINTDEVFRNLQIAVFESFGLDLKNPNVFNLDFNTYQDNTIDFKMGYSTVISSVLSLNIKSVLDKQMESRKLCTCYKQCVYYINDKMIFNLVVKYLDEYIKDSDFFVRQFAVIAMMNFNNHENYHLHFSNVENLVILLKIVFAIPFENEEPVHEYLTYQMRTYACCILLSMQEDYLESLQSAFRVANIPLEVFHSDVKNDYLREEIEKLKLI